MTLHPAGARLADLFQDTAAQLLAQLTDPDDVGEALREKLVVEAEDLSSLLREWVNQLINLAASHRILFRKIRVQKLETTPNRPYSARGEVIGELIDPPRHRFKLPLAGLRCTEAILFEEKGAWKAEIQLSH